jgi:hypothetical protein
MQQEQPNAALDGLEWPGWWLGAAWWGWPGRAVPSRSRTHESTVHAAATWLSTRASRPPTHMRRAAGRCRAARSVSSRRGEREKKVGGRDGMPELVPFHAVP